MRNGNEIVNLYIILPVSKGINSGLGSRRFHRVKITLYKFGKLSWCIIWNRLWQHGRFIKKAANKGSRKTLQEFKIWGLWFSSYVQHFEDFLCYINSSKDFGKRVIRLKSRVTLNVYQTQWTSWLEHGNLNSRLWNWIYIKLSFVSFLQ